MNKRLKEILKRKQEINDILNDENRSKDINFQELEQEVRELNKEEREIKGSNFKKVNTTGVKRENFEETSLLGQTALKREDSFAEAMGVNPEERSLNPYKYFKGLATGDWTGAEEERAMATEGQSGEHNIVPTELASRIIDKAREESKLVKAGAVVYPMDTKEVTLARVKDDPTAEWKKENAPITGSTVGFDGVHLNAKTLVAKVAMSIELFEDAPNSEAIVEHVLVEALAEKMDNAAFHGKGTDNEPLGLINMTGVNKMKDVGKLESYAPLTRAVQTLRENKTADDGATFFMSPSVVGMLDRLTNTNGDPLAVPASVRESKIAMTNTLNDGNNIVAGNFDNFLIGLRKGMTLEVSRTGSEAFNNLQVIFRIYMRADFATMNEKHFVIMENVETDEA